MRLPALSLPVLGCHCCTCPPGCRVAGARLLGARCPCICPGPVVWCLVAAVFLYPGACYLPAYCAMGYPVPQVTSLTCHLSATCGRRSLCPLLSTVPPATPSRWGRCLLAFIKRIDIVWIAMHGAISRTLFRAHPCKNVIALPLFGILKLAQMPV